MARADFGGSSSDFIYQRGAGGLVRMMPATLTMWSAEQGGTQYADLRYEGNATTTITVPSTGLVPTFQGPDGIYEMWASANGSLERVQLVAYGDAAADAAATAVSAATTATAAATAAAAVGTTNDTVIAGRLNALGSATQIAFGGLLKQRFGGNLADYGVDGASSANQSANINAALGNNPDKVFTVPPGDYRCDTGVTVNQGNGLVFLRGSRLYANATMDTLLDYDNGGASPGAYAADKMITGPGIIDANLKASKALAIGSVLRLTLQGLTIKNPVNRGILAKANGAEINAQDIRLYNTGTTNVSDNIAIESLMGDCTWVQVVARDFTIGAKDDGSGEWVLFHPWLGALDQLTARYPTSLGFQVGRRSRLVMPYIDTYRYGFRGAPASGYTSTKMTAVMPKFFCNTGNLSDALAAANPGAIYDMPNGDEFTTVAGEHYGHGTTAYAFTNGATTRFTAITPSAPVGGVSGIAEYRRGVKTQNTGGGTTSFSPTVIGSTTPGATTYTAQSGSLEVRDGIAWYRFRVTGNFGSTAAGNVRIGALPFPVGATVVSTGHGPLTRSVGAGAAVGVAGANGTSGPTTAIPQTISGAEVAVTASGAFDLWGEIACPFTYPS